MKSTSFTSIWQECLVKLKEVLSQTVFETWILPLILQEEQSQRSQRIILEAPDPFFKDWVSKNYISIIHDILKTNFHKEQAALRVMIIAKSGRIDQKLQIKDFQNRSSGKPEGNFILNPRFTFDNFVALTFGTAIPNVLLPMAFQ